MKMKTWIILSVILLVAAGALLWFAVRIMCTSPHLLYPSPLLLRSRRHPRWRYPETNSASSA
ncbi:MAG: hypothetical protein ACLQDF_11140 [Desulfomonilia bacterium]